jgi:uncharacterized membrane protein YbhN (UPF0104 family)
MIHSRRLRTLITLSIIFIFLAYFLANRNKFEPLRHLNIYLLALIAAANIAFIYVNGIFTKFILEPFKKFISISEAFYISVISSIGNFFAPAGTGFGIRAVYLKQKHGLPYSEFMSTLAGNYVLVLLVSSVVGLCSLFWLRESLNGQYIVLAAAFGGMFVLSMALIFLTRSKPPRTTLGKSFSTYLKNGFSRAIYGWGKISSDKMLVLKLLGITTFNLLISAIMYWAIITSVHLSIGLPELLLFTVLGTLTIFINITPANLGIKEAIYIFSASVLDFSVSQILLIALVDRGVQFSVLFLLWVFSKKTVGKGSLLRSNT